MSRARSENRNGDGAGQGETYSVPALSKAVEILELMSREPAGLSATDITARLGRSMGEIYRIIVALHRLGFLIKDTRHERYTLSLKMFELAHRHPPTERLVRAAVPILESVANEIQQSGHLGAINGDRLVVLAQVDSPLPMHYSVRIGSTFSALETSSGVVILAFSEPRQREPVLSGLTPAEREEMEQRFVRACELGYEQRESAVVHGVTNLSCPVFNHAGVPLAALTIPYLPQIGSAADMETSLRRTIDAADELSLALGWQPGNFNQE